jgi:AcrR family transcriptional regulator
MQTRRTRRTREASKQAILEAAERVLLAEGLEAVRVQRVAAAVGVTDAAVHYHFRNREGLIEALLRHAGRKLVADIAEASRPSADDDLDLAAVSRALSTAYVDRGSARMAVWLTLAGWRPQGSGLFRPLVERAHAMRIARAQALGRPPPALEDTRFLIALLNGAHIAQSIVGEAVMKAVDADWDPAGQRRFLDWTVALVTERLIGVEPP